MQNGELLARLNQMRDAASTIRNSAQRIDDIMARVDAQIVALDVERYSGAGAEQFRAEYMRLTPILREAHAKLWVFQEKLNLSADDIETAARPLEG
jgi:WXG100 family type VII secretion target